MKRNILTHLAVQSLKNQKQIYFPYALAAIILFSIEYIFISLVSNDYVVNRASTLPTVIGIGSFLSLIIIFVIGVYGLNFINRQQQKEFGLYTVLGLEKRHLRHFIGKQYVILWSFITLSSVITGYFLGQLLFLLLNKLMRQTGATLMDYPFSGLGAVGIIFLISAVFLFAYISQVIKIQRLQPVEILAQANTAEKEPKSRIFLALLGFLALGGGYYIALTTQGVIQALMWILLAAVLVIIGTYLLFMSLSIIVLKMLRHKKGFYYRPKSFLYISHMLFRMKSNAVSLSSIAVLCAGIILTLTTTLNLYRGMEKQVNQLAQADYMVTYAASDESKNEDNLLKELTERIKAKGVAVEESFNVKGGMATAFMTKDGFVPMVDHNQKGTPIFVSVHTIEGYNKLNHSNTQLAEDEVLITSNNLSESDYLTKTLALPQNVKRQAISKDQIGTSYGVDMIYIVVPNEAMLLDLIDAYPLTSPGTGERLPNDISYSGFINVQSDSKTVQDKIFAVEEDWKNEERLSPVYIESQLDFRKEVYTLNGGLLFIGLIVSLLLLIGTLLMLYFKQISEGYEDKENYKVMQQVGLPLRLIKQSIRQQIIWIFGLPIVIAVIHNIFAMPIMNRALGLLGVSNQNVYLQNLAMVVLGFTLIYLLAYTFTSRVYYQMIKE